MLITAILNGAIREAWIRPASGEPAAHVISTVVLCATILGIAWLTIGWLAPADREQAVAIGVLWLVLTLAFEFLAGHYLFRNPWSKLLADYDLLHGRIWVGVLITTFIAPLVSASGRLWRPRGPH